ncbi:DUF455 domain-containing protein [Helicobacter didelphidarum]|uniref:DUF455 domain-containing protein n=1 Tax=Helicobacter didelphidarum TaxID=2040648 RepID=A0A3D8IRM6_9HELI|nr:ferritin-like domain-containing protein [Helicobacter didelphidarum]RDU67586.1 DUF455 domain-containing protein [Helicobacter didelphidarum]
MEFFTAVFDALTTQNIESKKQKTKFLKENFSFYEFNHDSKSIKLKEPSFAYFCKISHPTRITRPKEVNSNVSLAKILHSVAHIEYNAIDLGLDAAYRFRHLQEEYYYDFIELANEEVEHFSLLESLLYQLGFVYGDFPVHSNLFEAMQQSQTLIDRMALVHKGLEALGLDANPFVAKKIIKSNAPLKNQILETLNIILHDEIKHVSKGSKWLKYAQEKENDTRSLDEILKRFQNFNIIGKIPNIQARIKAGYTYNEITALQNLLIIK